ncbi:MAG: hypothetical protein HKN56_03560 [Gammaproteobacteria bacterium]|nr:hypothetical protein [Gammaproteobacteria bacterium]NND54034.1 hypothetical protein [Gammaproteobacteria bacterium]
MKISGALIFSVYALTHAAIAVGALLLVPRAPVVATGLFVVEAVTAYDSLIVVLGKHIGINRTAERLNRMRFFLHAVCIGLLVPVYTGLGALAGVPALAAFAATTAAWVAAAVIAALGYSLQYRRLGHIMPVNSFGCLRYAQSVDDTRRYPGYDYSEAELAQNAMPPLASILTVTIGLAIALWIGLAAGFWLPFIVTALMFSAASFPDKTWGPLLTSCLEIFFSAGLLYSLWALTFGSSPT